MIVLKLMIILQGLNIKYDINEIEVLTAASYYDLKGINFHNYNSISYIVAL